MNGLSRRTFLESAGAAALSAAAAHGALAGQPTSITTPPRRDTSRRRTLKKAVMYGMVGDGSSVLEKFRILRECGFQGVEIDSPSPINPAEIIQAQRETGIKVHGLVDSVHWKFHLNNPEPQVRERGFEALRTAITDAKKYGSTSILLVPALVNAEQSYDDAWRLSQEQVRRVLPLAAETRVVIGIENVWNNFLLSPLEAARYVDEFKSPWVRWHLDIGNAINYGWPDQWARILGERVVKLHIKDFSRSKRDKEGLWKGFDVELGDGDAGWPAVMKALDDIGYSTAPDGRWATAEVGGGGRDRLKKISEQMDRLFAM